MDKLMKMLVFAQNNNAYIYRKISREKLIRLFILIGFIITKSNYKRRINIRKSIHL